MEPPISFRITHKFDSIVMTEAEFNQLLQVASWSSPPWFPFPGRTAWYTFDELPSRNAAAREVFPAAKLKGVGIWNPQQSEEYSGVHGGEYCDQPCRPTLQEYIYTSQLVHVGFDCEGHFCQVKSEITPFGGIRHSRALREYSNALLLCNSGVPCITPFMVIEYQDKYIFHGERLGAAISLSPESSPYRLHPLHLGEANCGSTQRMYYQAVRASLGIAGDPNDEQTRLRVIGSVSRQIGKLLHDFASVGLYRHSGGWDNLQFSLRHRQVFLTDLDSSRSLQDLDVKVRPLQVLRDLASALHKLLNKLYYPTVLENYTVANLVRHDPLFEMILGYFPSASESDVRRITGALWRYFVPHFCLLRRHREPIMHSWTSEQRKSYKMEEDFFYVLAIVALYPLYLLSDLNHIYPANLTVHDIEHRAYEYLGERYEYLQFILNSTPWAAR